MTPIAMPAPTARWTQMIVRCISNDANSLASGDDTIASCRARTKRILGRLFRARSKGSCHHNEHDAGLRTASSLVSLIATAALAFMLTMSSAERAEAHRGWGWGIGAGIAAAVILGGIYHHRHYHRHYYGYPRYYYAYPAYGYGYYRPYYHHRAYYRHRHYRHWRRW